MYLQRKIVAGGDPDIRLYDLCAGTQGIFDLLRAAVIGCDAEGKAGDANYYRQLMRDLQTLQGLPTPAQQEVK